MILQDLVLYTKVWDLLAITTDNHTDNLNTKWCIYSSLYLTVNLRGYWSSLRRL